MERPKLNITPSHVLFAEIFFAVMMFTVFLPSFSVLLYALLYGLGVNYILISGVLAGFTLSALVFDLLYMFE